MPLNYCREWHPRRKSLCSCCCNTAIFWGRLFIFCLFIRPFPLRHSVLIAQLLTTARHHPVTERCASPSLSLLLSKISDPSSSSIPFCQRLIERHVAAHFRASPRAGNIHRGALSSKRCRLLINPIFYGLDTHTHTQSGICKISHGVLCDSERVGWSPLPPNRLALSTPRFTKTQGYGLPPSQFFSAILMNTPPGCR